jgi:TonB family protein
MSKRITPSLALILLSAFVLHSQQSSNPPFSTLEKAIKDERGGWAGNKQHLSTVFDAERKRLGDGFETELLKWLGNDPEKHDWISYFLEHEGYLHGNRPLPHLSLLVKQQGLILVRDKDDEESRQFVLRFSVTAAILSSELGFTALASSYKNEAEGLLLRQPELEMSIGAGSEADRRRYDEIESAVQRKTPILVSDPNPPPKATISGGILNSRSLNNVKPSYPKAAHEAGASGKVDVRVVIDETGKVIWARAISGHPLLQQSSEDAAWQTKFPVTKLSGQPVKVSGTLLYNFVP